MTEIENAASTDSSGLDELITHTQWLLDHHAAGSSTIQQRALSLLALVGAASTVLFVGANSAHFSVASAVLVTIALSFLWGAGVSLLWAARPLSLKLPHAEDLTALWKSHAKVEPRKRITGLQVKADVAQKLISTGKTGSALYYAQEQERKRATALQVGIALLGIGFSTLAATVIVTAWQHH